MQNDPLNVATAGNVVGKFFSFAEEQLLNAGFAADRIWLDPGIGFGKSDGANLNLMTRTGEWGRRYNIAIGVSRKSWLGRTLDIPIPKDRDKPPKVMELSLWIAGAKLIRTHDVKGLNVFRTLLQRAD
jgi:dihydropteroate synthase